MLSSQHEQNQLLNLANRKVVGARSLSPVEIVELLSLHSGGEMKPATRFVTLVVFTINSMDRIAQSK